MPLDQREGEKVIHHTFDPALSLWSSTYRVHSSLSFHSLCFFTTLGVDVSNRQTSVELIFVNEE